ncbi:MAG TPA: hypothetical protein VEJ23_07705, partial [Solirubrobacteraceae bacterium]|nr:hypothetical protein [Solirubrobacteraceae bacterium]
MSERGMTRRSVLTASAGVLAGGLLRRGEALAAVARPFAARPARGGSPRLFWRSLGDLAAGGQSMSVDLRRNADLLGLSYRAGVGVRVQLRFRVAGRWTVWTAAGPGAHGPEGERRSPTTTGDPVWTGGTQLVQVRADGALRDVRIACVDVSAGAGARRLALAGPAALDASLPLATPTLAAGPGQPPILARRAWAQGMAPPR